MPKHTTHVANAYHENIWVFMEGDRAYMTSGSYSGSLGSDLLKVTASASVKTQYDWQYAQKHGFTKIAPREVLGFNPDAKDRGKVYITILTQSGGVVCVCFPKNSDYSVIVAANGTVKSTKYGQLWVDEQGVRH